MAILNLQQAAGEAVQALRRNLACGVPSVEVRAAAVILKQAIGATELRELEARVKQLEAHGGWDVVCRVLIPAGKGGGERVNSIIYIIGAIVVIIVILKLLGLY